MHWALETLDKHPNIKADLIDLRTLQPLDIEMIIESVKKTSKVIILQEDTLFGSMASEISAQITEKCFVYLDAPVRRIGSIETPIPFDKDLESQFLSKNRFENSLLDLISY